MKKKKEITQLSEYFLLAYKYLDLGGFLLINCTILIPRLGVERT